MREQKITVPTVGSNPGFTATQTYAYDSLNRIQSATETVSSTQTWKQTFTYDRFGNRRFDTANNNTTTIPAGCSTAVCNPTVSTANNRFSSGQGYSYDPNGALTQDATGQRFGYDAESHQKEFFSASNQTTTPDATYLYDGEGKRVKKIVGDRVTIFVYDANGQLAAEYDTQIETVKPQVSYLTTDHLGSPRIITDENGAVTSRKDFAAFGDEITTSERVGGTTGNGYNPPNVRQDYTGYQKDGESGLEYAQARYYNTGHGRFTSVDPLTASATIRNPQTFNRYSYVTNSPYKFVDPLGLVRCNLGRCVQVGGGDWFTSSASSGADLETTKQREQQRQTATNTNASGAQLQAEEPEPPPIPVVVGIAYWRGLPVKFYGEGNIEGTDGNITEEREARLNDPSQLAAPGTPAPPPGVIHKTNYFVSFSMRSTGASLEGYGYEVTYDRDQFKDVPKPEDRITGRQTIGAEGDIPIGKYFITDVSRDSAGFNTKLTGDYSKTSTGTITIYSPDGGQVARSTFSATLRTRDADTTYYSYDSHVVETSRTTRFGTWTRPSP